MTTSIFWRVQYIGRPQLDQSDEDMGRRDFNSESEARAYYDSAEVRSSLGTYWRAEIRKHTETVEIVASTPYGGEGAGNPVVNGHGKWCASLHAPAGLTYACDCNEEGAQ